MGWGTLTSDRSKRLVPVVGGVRRSKLFEDRLLRRQHQLRNSTQSNRDEYDIAAGAKTDER